MSCILFSEASYLALATSDVFGAGYRATVQAHYPTPAAFAAALFALNVRAFGDRYEGRYGEDVTAARVSPMVESAFVECLAVPGVGRDARAALLSLLNHVDYQCMDVADYQTNPVRLQLLGLIDWCGSAVVIRQAAVLAPTAPELITRAADLVKAAHADNASLHRALGKAAERMAVAPWCFDAQTGTLAIQSQSHPSEVQYADADSCACPTQKGVCYHRAGALLCAAIVAVGVQPVAALPLPAAYRQLDDAAGIVAVGYYGN